jgi:hypothetical protein
MNSIKFKYKPGDTVYHVASYVDILNPTVTVWVVVKPTPTTITERDTFEDPVTGVKRHAYRVREGYFVREKFLFSTQEEAEEYCKKHNKK